MIKKHPTAEPPTTVITFDTTVALFSKELSAKDIAQSTTTDRVENVESETTDTFAAKELFEVPKTEFDFLAIPRYKVRISIGVKTSDQYSTSY